MDRDTTTDSSQQLVVLQRVDHLCERFEAASKSKQCPRIEEFLHDADASIRAILFEELLRLDYELRSKSEEQPSEQEYLKRFPTYRKAISCIASGL